MAKIHRARSSRRRRGLTLVETIVAVAVLAVSLLMLTQAVFNSIKLDELNREKLWVRQVCRQKAESILATQFSAIKGQWANSANGVFDITMPVNNTRTVTLKPPAGIAHVGSITIDDFVQGDSNCYRVIIQAKWRSGYGAPVTVQYVVNAAKPLD
jgi:prepilin-type N-terminal cleavage/methylation domain-containing protein